MYLISRSFYRLFILVIFFFISFISLLQAQNRVQKTYTFAPVKEGEVRYCLRYRQQLYEFYSEGILYDKGTSDQTKQEKIKAIAKVDGGCFVVKTTICKLLDEVIFKPKLLKGFNYAYYFKLPQRNGKCYFKNPGWNLLNMDYKTFGEMNNLNIAIPYVKNIVLNHPALLKEISPQVAKCNTLAGKQKTTCQINQTYNYLVSRYRYIADNYTPFTTTDLIYTPRQTINRGGGDCEDLSGLLLSYLINQNIESYLILTDDHAYGMACGVDSKILKELIHKKFETVDTQEKTIQLRPGELSMFSFTQGKNFPLKMKVELMSSASVNIYRVNSRREIKKLQYRQPFSYEKNCSKLNTRRAEIKCETSSSSFTVIEYPRTGKKPINVKLRISYYYNTIKLQKNLNIRYYIVNNRKCVVLEPTAGKAGYPGFSVDRARRKIAINPKTYQWFYLQ